MGNGKSFLFGFGKHDNEFLVAPNYVLLKIILKKVFAFSEHILSDREEQKWLAGRGTRF